MNHVARLPSLRLLVPLSKSVPYQVQHRNLASTVELRSTQHMERHRHRSATNRYNHQAQTVQISQQRSKVVPMDLSGGARPVSGKSTLLEQTPLDNSGQLLLNQKVSRALCNATLLVQVVLASTHRETPCSHSSSSLSTFFKVTCRETVGPSSAKVSSGATGKPTNVFNTLPCEQVLPSKPSGKQPFSESRPSQSSCHLS